MPSRHVSVVGLGRLGLCFAASLANAGYDVTGTDIDEDIVETVSKDTAPYPEPGLQAYLDDAGDRLTATTDTAGAVADSDATFVFVNTPLSEDGHHSLDSVLAVCRTVGEVLPETDDYHVVTVRSTVMPGSVDGPIRETLEESSGLTAGEEFGLCYNPEFTAMGEIIDGLERPDFFLIGEQSARAGDVVADVCRTICDNDAPIHRMRPASAEMAKMMNNTYRTMKISFANTMGQIAEGVDADIDEVMASLESDSIINTKYLEPAARYGGPCYSRDNDAFESLAEDAGAVGHLATATDRVNAAHTEWVANAVRRTLDSGTVAILGLSYKPGTPIAENSQGVELAAALDREYDLVCADPAAVEDARDRIDAAVSFVDAETAVSMADLAVIATPWDEFTDPSLYATSGIVLFDLWRCLDADAFETVDYRPFGKDGLDGTVSE
ncbi:nucleotide sugar dehydrogenase [Halorientalis pallida]|uniref:nucleotide sugar dehydrogenase n=1 Tax=Halorientalis pallida TaxID=2479928 RepID=UPI003C70022F